MIHYSPIVLLFYEFNIKNLVTIKIMAKNIPMETHIPLKPNSISRIRLKNVLTLTKYLYINQPAIALRVKNKAF